MSIGRRIAERRKEVGMTQAALAATAEVSPACISQVENGFRNASLETLLLLVPALNTTLDYLVNGAPANKIGRLSYAVEQRLRLIDFLLDQYGTLNRAALMDYFGISTPQASADIKTYLALAPENAEYDKTGKTYVRGASFKRLWA